MLVHDAARPCLPREDLRNLIEETRMDQIGGILALPVAETVKKAAKDEAGAQRVAGTEDRSQLWLAQTPQMFRAGLLAQALQRAQGAVTDEASAIEQMGLKPRLVTGSRRNLKVTYPEDVAIAETLLAANPAAANP
jgi:2-C-methyl-D-erythritol 4-phosphate cytidylyltransferase